MIKWCVGFAVAIILVGIMLDAYACTPYTIINSDGTYKTCVICGTMISCS